MKQKVEGKVIKQPECLLQQMGVSVQVNAILNLTATFLYRGKQILWSLQLSHVLMVICLQSAAVSGTATNAA